MICGINVTDASNSETNRELKARSAANRAHINSFELVLAEAAEADLAKTRIMEARKAAREAADAVEVEDRVASNLEEVDMRTMLVQKRLLAKLS